MPLADCVSDASTFVLVEAVDEEPGAAIATRRKALGMSVTALADKANLHRNTVAAVEAGRTAGTSLGQLQAVLSRLEDEMGMDTPDLVTSTIELTDGTKVMFAGTATGVADAAARYVKDHSA